MRIDQPTGQLASLTGSFSGSFTGTGNFDGLTADAVAYTNVTGKPTLVSGSGQIDAQSATNPSAIFDNSGTPELRSGITAAEVRTAISVDEAGTDNSTDVTIAAGRDYITISGQELTLGQIDISDDTNLTVSDTTGQTGIDLTLSGDTLSGTVVGLGTGNDVQFANLTLTGDLTVQGTTTTINSTAVEIADVNILLASGSADSAAANGAGLTVDGADATFTYTHSGTKWNMNKALDMGANNITTTGTIAGATLNTGQGDNELYAMNQAVQTTDDVQFDSFGVGTAASGTTGEIRATNDVTAFYSSDERLKENIVEIEAALHKVRNLRGVEYDWKALSDEERKTIHSHEGHDIGVVAQEVQAVFPDLVTQRDHGYLAVDYSKLTAVLIQAVKELADKVDELSK
tara:strand:+ start:22 stop:1227 length:1206 start_codon:yes stop_codon:yes gene_type:complete